MMNGAGNNYERTNHQLFPNTNDKESQITDKDVVYSPNSTTGSLSNQNTLDSSINTSAQLSNEGCPPISLNHESHDDDVSMSNNSLCSIQTQPRVREDKIDIYDSSSEDSISTDSSLGLIRHRPPGNDCVLKQNEDVINLTLSLGLIECRPPPNDRRHNQNKDVINVDDCGSDGSSVGLLERHPHPNDRFHLQNEDVINVDSSSDDSSLGLIRRRRAPNDLFQNQNEDVIFVDVRAVGFGNELSRRNIPEFPRQQNAGNNPAAARQNHHESNCQEFTADVDHPIQLVYLYDSSPKSEFIEFLFQCSNTFCSNIEKQIADSIRIGANVITARFFSPDESTAGLAPLLLLSAHCC